MTRILPIFVLLICSTSFAQARFPDLPKDTLPDSLVLVELSEGTSINWSVRSSKIVHDRYFSLAEKMFPLNKKILIDLIADSTETSVTACGIDRMLTRGELAFLLIDEIKNLPNRSIIDMQFDVLEWNCPYPLYYLDFINHNRVDIRKKVKLYLK